MHTYRFDAEDLDRIYNQFQVPQSERASYTEDDIRCPRCSWTSAALYVLPSSYDEAERLLAGGYAGVCGECYAEMLTGRTPN